MGDKVRDGAIGVVVALAFVASTFGVIGVVKGYQASQFLSEVLYKDNAGNVVTRQQVLKLVGENALQVLLQNAAKQQQQAPQAPVPPDVK